MEWMWRWVSLSESPFAYQPGFRPGQKMTLFSTRSTFTANFWREINFDASFLVDENWKLQVLLCFFVLHKIKLTRKIIRTWCTTRRKINRFLMWNKTGWNWGVCGKEFLLQRFFLSLGTSSAGAFLSVASSERIGAEELVARGAFGNQFSLWSGNMYLNVSTC